MGDGARLWEQHQEAGGRAWQATSDSILVSGSLLGHNRELGEITIITK